MTNSPSHTPILTKEWRKYNTLIVDDEPAVLEQIEDDLFGAGFNFVKATSAEEGLEILEKQPINVILTDQKMPGGLSGTQFLAEVRKTRPHIVGIILSAFQDSEHILDALNQARAFSYLLKPWGKEELTECINKALQLAYHSQLETRDQNLYQMNLLDQTQRNQRELRYTQGMLTQAVRELNHTQGALKEATHTLATISDATGQLSGKLMQPLRNRMSYFPKHGSETKLEEAFVDEPGNLTKKQQA